MLTISFLWDKKYRKISSCEYNLYLPPFLKQVSMIYFRVLNVVIKYAIISYWKQSLKKKETNIYQKQQFTFVKITSSYKNP